MRPCTAEATISGKLTGREFASVCYPTASIMIIVLSMDQRFVTTIVSTGGTKRNENTDSRHQHDIVEVMLAALEQQPDVGALADADQFISHKEAARLVCRSVTGSSNSCGESHCARTWDFSPRATKWLLTTTYGCGLQINRLAPCAKIVRPVIYVCF